MTRTIGASDELFGYLIEHAGEHPAQRKLREKTSTLEMSMMQIGPDQGAFLSWLVRLLGAKRTLEVGVFTGYSSLSVALGLPADGRMVACDVSEEWTSIAREAWKEAGVAEKIDLRLAPAVQTLDELLAAGQAGTFDFAFIDADKENYDAYYERCLELVRSGGVVAVDNCLWGGSVARPDDDRASTVAIRRLNDKVLADDRVQASIVTVGDGILLAQKLA